MNKDEAIQLALEALRFALHVGFDESSETQIKKRDKAWQQHHQAINAIKEALETKEGLLDRKSYLFGLYDQKPWVGLTPEDMKDEKTHNFDFVNGARWAEEILKEKNT